MADCGCDADKITRWVIKKCYRISKPSPDQIARYRYWHAVSRGPGGFTASGPWECWLSREIPGAAVPEPTSLPVPAPPETICSDSEQTPETVGEGFAGSESEPVKSRPPSKRRGRPRRVQQAQALLQEQLAEGPKPGVLVEAAAAAAEIPERSLIRAADALGVRTRRGEWWLPG